MDIFSLLKILLYPFTWTIEGILDISMKLFEFPLFSLILLSITVNVILIPAYLFADKLADQERKVQVIMAAKKTEIKLNFQGYERFMLLQTLYRLNNYHPLMALRSSVAIAIQLPFFIATYVTINQYTPFHGVSLFGIADLSQPDKLLSIGDHHGNFLPVIMLLLNIVSVNIYLSKEYRTERIQNYILAGLFFIILYNQSASLLLYWTMNNIVLLYKSKLFSKKHTELS